MSQSVNRKQLRDELTNLLDDLKVNYDEKDGVILATCTDGAMTITLANAAKVEDLT